MYSILIVDDEPNYLIVLSELLRDEGYEVFTAPGGLQAIEVARPYFAQHRQAFLQRLHDYRDIARNEFERIDRLTYDRPFDACLHLAEDILA